MGLPAVLLFVIPALAALACGSPRPPPSLPPSPSEERLVAVSERVRALVDAPDRLEEDFSLDPGRHPAELLSFVGVGPGMRIAELVSGAGYTAELLARAVAPDGVVYAENPNVILENSGRLWAQRLARPAARTIIRVDRELDDPLPPDAKELDLVVINLVYHDTVWLGVDRAKMNGAVYRALKRGGAYAVVDHSARPGRGLADVQTLHRIDEQSVRREVESAGFVLKTASSFLRNPADARDWNDSPAAASDRRGTSDRFALLFVKP